uniref:DUF4371 domain-containing protein n=1 Tax=Cannabis sativa TaxID=3483 RepID=A0A803PIJ7_CANSA
MARIEKYFKRVDPDSSYPPEVGVDSSTTRRCVSINMDDLPTDPGLRVPISNYSPNTQDQIRRHYLQQGPCKLKNHEFPPKYFRGVDRQFNIECSHYECYKKCEALMNEKQQIQHILLKKESKDRKNYRVRLTASVESIRFLLRQGLAFRGHDESEDSNNQGKFLELLKFLADHNEEVRAVVLKNSPENLRLTSPKIQKDIVNACAIETISVIIKDMEDVVVSILVDESRDVSIKEQMVVMFCYVDKKGLTRDFSWDEVIRCNSTQRVVRKDLAVYRLAHRLDLWSWIGRLTIVSLGRMPSSILFCTTQRDTRHGSWLLIGNLVGPPYQYSDLLRVIINGCLLSP